MDKKEINDLMKRRNANKSDKVRPVDLFDAPLANQQGEVSASQENVNLTKYTTYLTDDLITRIKIEAALQKKKSYQIIQQALEEFFSEHKDNE